MGSIYIDDICDVAQGNWLFMVPYEVLVVP